MKVLRQATTAGETIKYDFGKLKGKRWLVKNFTDGDICVSFVENAPKEDCVLIPADTAQVIEAGSRGRGYLIEKDALYITAESNSEKGVEVQLLEW